MTDKWTGMNTSPNVSFKIAKIQKKKKKKIQNCSLGVELG